MLIRLDYLKTTDLTLLRQPTRRIIRNDPGHSFGIAFVTTAVKGRLVRNTSVALILARMIIFGKDDSVDLAAAFNAVD